MLHEAEVLEAGRIKLMKLTGARCFVETLFESIVQGSLASATDCSVPSNPSGLGCGSRNSLELWPKPGEHGGAILAHAAACEMMGRGVQGI